MASEYVKIQTSRGYINVKEGTNFPINFAVSDIRDLTKKKGTFSKSIQATWDDNNHEILGQLFDINATNFDFDRNLITECSVIQNGIPIVEDAYLQLITINESQHSSPDQDDGNYILLVKSAQSDLFTKLGAKELDELDFTDLNHTYSAANVQSSFTHDYTDGYVYPMGINDNSIFYLSDFRPGIYLRSYLDRIHATNGFSYEIRDLAIADKLFIPYNGEEPKTDYEDYLVDIEKLSFVPTLGSPIETWTENQDNENIFNPTLGRYTPPFYFGAGQFINHSININFDIELVNATGADAYLVDSSASIIDIKRRWQAKVQFRKNGIVQQGTVTAPLNNPTDAEWAESDGALANGTTSVFSGTITTAVGQSNLLPTDYVDIIMQLQESSSGFGQWRDSASTSGNIVTITPQINVTSLEIVSNLSVNLLGFGQEVVMNQFVPDKIKQRDLIKSFCTAFNLMTFPDPDNPNKVIYQPRDNYYDEGNEKNWDRKLVKQEAQITKFLSDTQKKRVQFSYKDDKDSYNTVYKDAIKETYGQAEFIFDSEFIKDIERKELIFSPTPATEISIGAIVPALVGGAPKNNIRLLIHNGTETCSAFNIYDYATTGQTGLTDYPVCLHFDNPTNPTVDINFAVCDYYFYQGLTLTNNNLFNLYWRRSMGQLNSGKMMTAMFDLNEGDIANLKLNDKIYCKNTWWNINRVIDYNANAQKATKVELITVDDGINLQSFRFRPVLPSFDGDITNPLGDLIDDLYTLNNVNYSSGRVIIKGKNNTVSRGVQGYISGSDSFIDEEGYWLNGVKIAGDTTNVNPPTQDLVLNVVDNNYEVSPGFEDIVVASELSTVAFTITLPNPQDHKGKRVYIKSKSPYTTTVDVVAPYVIDNDLPTVLIQWESLTLVSDGAKWLIL